MAIDVKLKRGGRENGKVYYSRIPQRGNDSKFTQR